MNSSFPERLSNLRRERAISQRQAASELGISQALLSHYENGAREPGLGFVCKACDYYGVSADYLLCRSDEPCGPARTLQAARGYFNSIEALINSARAELDALEEQI